MTKATVLFFSRTDSFSGYSKANPVKPCVFPFDIALTTMENRQRKKLGAYSCPWHQIFKCKINNEPVFCSNQTVENTIENQFAQYNSCKLFCLKYG